MTKLKREEVIEKLAELEHLQWESWTKYISKKLYGNAELIANWKLNWKPYSELTEELKEKDRIWARKAAEVLFSDHENFEKWKLAAKQKLKERFDVQTFHDFIDGVFER